MDKNEVTPHNYEVLAHAFDHFNRRLFNGILPECLITFQRMRGAYGYYWQGVIHARRGKREKDEIALNPDTFPDRSDRDVISTLVHEMVHCWQAHYGTPGRRGYHNAEWAKKMKLVGLRPSSTGRKGGKQTGDRMSHYIIQGGAFEKHWGTLYRSGFRLEWETTPRESSRSKVKYTCPGCRVSVWGKPGLKGLLACYLCRYFFNEVG